MIELIFGGMIYGAALVGCYDGDTCRVTIDNAPPFLATQSLRFQGFDTPEIRGKCQQEKKLAKDAKAHTIKYLRANTRLVVSGDRGKYGRLIVEAPGLAESLISSGLAKPYHGGKRKGWCND